MWLRLLCQICSGTAIWSSYSRARLTKRGKLLPLNGRLNLGDVAEVLLASRSATALTFTLPLCQYSRGPCRLGVNRSSDQMPLDVPLLSIALMQLHRVKLRVAISSSPEAGSSFTPFHVPMNLLDRSCGTWPDWTQCCELR